MNHLVVYTLRASMRNAIPRGGASRGGSLEGAAFTDQKSVICSI